MKTANRVQSQVFRIKVPRGKNRVFSNCYDMIKVVTRYKESIIFSHNGKKNLSKIDISLELSDELTLKKLYELM